MNFEEFLQPTNKTDEETARLEENETHESEIVQPQELDVQKVVVQSLAEEKAEQEERIRQLEQENQRLTAEKNELTRRLDEQESQFGGQTEKIRELEAKVESLTGEIAKTSEILEKNSESELSNQVALLDRSVELPDRFVGETREQVLDAIREARNRAEEEGRTRRAQVLEAVLVANVSTGELEKKRKALEKFFNDNQNILSGPVINELVKCGISYKNGENYLLPAEIIKRTY